MFFFGGDIVKNETFVNRKDVREETLAEKAQRDNRSKQLNPNNWRYWASRNTVPPWER